MIDINTSTYIHIYTQFLMYVLAYVKDALYIMVIQLGCSIG